MMKNLKWKRTLLWATGAIGTALLIDKIAIAAPILQDVTVSSGTNIWSVLLPLATASIGVERATEIVWNYVEWLMLSSKRWLPANLKSAQYMQFKSGSSMLLGVVIGILVSNYTGMRLFEYLSEWVPTFLAGVPSVWDVIITGLIIGSGAKPAHEILGIITQFKHFLGNSAIMQRESAGAALAEGVLKLAESESKMMIDVPGVGPSRLPSPQSAMAPGGLESMGEDGEGAEELAPSRTARYVEILHNATAQ